MKFLISLKPLDKEDERKLMRYMCEEDGFRDVVEGIHVYSDEKPFFQGNNFLFGYKLNSKYEIHPVNDDENYKEIDEVLDGKYIFIDSENRVLFNDPLGIQPVYIGKYALSNSKKYLWLINEKNIFQLPPNRLWGIEENGIFSKKKFLIRYNYTEKKNIDFEDASQILKEHLIWRMRKIASFVNVNVKDIYILFSGGIDSSLTYMLSKKTGLNPWLVTVANKNSYDLKASKLSAESLNAYDKHILLTINRERVKIRDIKKIVEIIESYDLMQVSLALPLYLLAKYNEDKYAILMGQGSDELFGGYMKYIQLYKSKGEDSVEEEIIRDVLLSYRYNFSREMKIADSTGKYLIYPLISPGIVKFVMQLPIKYKIRKDDEVRKWLIRKVAENMNMPIDIILRKKKSMQYSSGSQKIISNLLGKRKMMENLYEYYIDVIKKYN